MKEHFVTYEEALILKQNEFNEGNKLIAEFMGDYRAKYKVSNDYTLANAMLKTLKYHSSWDWLMPVVENISRWADVNKDKYNEYFWREPYHTDFLIFRMEINELWLAVVEFIKWYNANKWK